jgi:phospholipid-binding lipoprotein MlaA
MRNVLSNWGGPFIIMNDLLQLKPKRAARSLGRFLLNTLLGLGGIFDVAKDKKFNIPHHGNSFANTLGFYGIKLGPYVYLPILGPTTLLDQADRAQGFIPLFDNPIFRDGRGPALGYLSGLDERANSDQELKALLDDSIDPYATFRTTWLQDRQGQIESLKAPDGQEPGSVANPDALDDPLVDPAGAAASAPVGSDAPSPEAPAPQDATPAQ